MGNKNEVETLNTQEKEDSLKPIEGKEPLKKSDELSDDEKQSRLDAFPRNYKRMKDAEEANKATKLKLQELQKQLDSQFEKTTLTDEQKNVKLIAEISSALEGLDSDEKARVISESRFKGCSLSEARKDKDFIRWQKSYQEEKSSELATPEPTSHAGVKVGKKSVHELSKEEIRNNWQELTTNAVKVGKRKKREII